jgi:hypothetical protein
LHPADSAKPVGETEGVALSVRIRRRWYRDAVCAGVPVHVFFPSTSPRHTMAASARANHAIRQYCQRCPVRVECLAECLRSAEVHAQLTGIRGGFHFPDAPTKKTITAAERHLAAILRGRA